jgi:hypothetical protein
MPHCYSLIVSLSSSLDPTTNMWNLLGLVDHIQTSTFPLTLPVHTHALWSFSAEEIAKAFEARLVLSLSTTHMGLSEPLPLTSCTPYAHLRLRGLVLDRVGAYQTHIEWRETGAHQWTREHVFWPFRVSQSP